MIWRGIDFAKERENSEGKKGEGEAVAAVGEAFRVRKFGADRRRHEFAQRGRRTAVQADHGRYVRAALPHQPITCASDLALDATLRQAAVRRSRHPSALILHPSDYRRKVREAKMGNLILFVVDASGSMAARQRMTAVKGAILSLLLDAYQKRDEVGLITFRGERAEVVLPPTRSVELAQQRLAELPTGGRTPLAAALTVTNQMLDRYSKRSLVPLVVLLSDGRANISAQSSNPSSPFLAAHKVAKIIAERGVSALVLDCESGRRRLGLAQQLASALNARYLLLEEIAAEAVARPVRDMRR